MLRGLAPKVQGAWRFAPREEGLATRVKNLLEKKFLFYHLANHGRPTI